MHRKFTKSRQGLYFVDFLTWTVSSLKPSIPIVFLNFPHIQLLTTVIWTINQTTNHRNVMDFWFKCYIPYTSPAQRSYASKHNQNSITIMFCWFCIIQVWRNVMACGKELLIFLDHGPAVRWYTWECDNIITCLVRDLRISRNSVNIPHHPINFQPLDLYDWGI